MIEPVVLDRELDVLHVAVVRLEIPHRLQQLRVRGGQPLLHRDQRLGRPDAGNDVLALRVDEELAERRRLAGRRVARERDAGAGALALVAEDHLHDVHGRAEVVRDVVRAAVDLRARRLPRVEDGDDGADQLLVRVLRERPADVLLVDLPEGRHEAGEVVGRELDVLADASRRLQALELLLEAVRIDSVDGLAVHLDQAPVRVVREARVAGGGCETRRRPCRSARR